MWIAQYNPRKSLEPYIRYDNDIALLKLATPVDYDVNIIPICLPPDDNKLVGEKAWVKGWGRLYEGKYNGNTFGYAW